MRAHFAQGPWLQLPIELLESLMVVNMDPTALGVWTDARSSHSPSVLDDPTGPLRLRDHAYIGDAPRSPSPRSPGDAPRAGSPPPPPVDPGVFHAVTSIRRLVDEASELAVRASAGVGSAPAASPRGPGGWMGGGGYNYVYGTDPNSLYGGAGGRTLPLSATRIHRLRALAVQKLAAAYKLDEVAASVMVMQGGSVFDDIAQRVLRHGRVLSHAPAHALLTRAAAQTHTTSTRNTCTSSTRRSRRGAPATARPCPRAQRVQAARRAHDARAAR
jgi:hypothetical protein